jgi:cation transport ATPase
MGFFWELVTLIDIMLLGHWIEMRSVRQASGALDELAALMPDTAEQIMEDGSIEKIPLDMVKVIHLSRSSYRKMIQNLWWAAGYNLIALPLAAGVLAPAGVVLSPAVGAVLMSLSTIVVAMNAQLLRRLKFPA